ncbi:MAG: GIY-YIG nuclease family protein [Alphaproteobacteria bacterium]|nr:GIY-YIG nuclease family protein [Alphaproteobacteria bacterium]MBV9694090.1 GIY-YIG nuclease family protein [Alphaproteobacteria bacterium]
MKREDKKAAVAAYKERKPEPGIYLVRCAATGQSWAGAAPQLSAIWNRMSFALRQGAGSPASLQAAWREHGADSFSFEIVENMDPEDLSYSRDRILRERRDRWCETLNAEAI